MLFVITILFDIFIYTEIAHAFTDKGSDLVYAGESGGMNEGLSEK